MQHNMVQQLSSIKITAPDGNVVVTQAVRVIKYLLVHAVTYLRRKTHVDFIPNCPLRIPDGIYFIRNASDGRVLEAEEYKSATAVHIYLAPSREGRLQTQLWCITRNHGKEFDYTIQNFALGSVADVYVNSSRQGARVVCHGPNGGGNQSWAFYGSRRGPSYGA